jgi:DNA invertase Pin-like site-specific DNA recombinase
LDFARIMQLFEQHGVAFVSVTQQFNTASSMGRLILNVLLSFAQFERELIAERTRDKIAAARRKGKWAGGLPLLGYDVDPRSHRLVVRPLFRKTAMVPLQSLALLDSPFALARAGHLDGTCSHSANKPGTTPRGALVIAAKEARDKVSPKCRPNLSAPDRRW